LHLNRRYGEWLPERSRECPGEAVEDAQ
jgi:hypothetical protein